MKLGKLVAAGVGYQTVGQTTPETVDAIAAADEVFYVCGDPLQSYWLTQVNPNAVSLLSFYVPGVPRTETYERMIETVLARVREGAHVCFVTYGHPGVLASPTHAAVARARREGFEAIMLPAISAEDCLFADLGVDPGAPGCLSMEANRFLRHPDRVPTAFTLILWQIAAVGEDSVAETSSVWNPSSFRLLCHALERNYGGGHECVVYEAPVYAFCEPVVLRGTIGTLVEAPVTLASTLYVPPLNS